VKRELEGVGVQEWALGVAACKSLLDRRTHIWWYWIMLGEGGTPFAEFREAARKFLARAERGNIDLADYRAVIDALDGDFGSEARDAQRAGAHLVSGNVTAASWIARTCKMSVTSAADRLRVGEQLESLPKVAAALASGEIGYQSASQLSRLRDKLGEKRDLFNEEEMLGFAREFSVRHLRELCDVAWHVVDPDGFFKESEENYTRRRLHISQMADGMYAIDGLADPVTGAALKTVVDALAKRKGPDDERTAAQRRHDALGELVNHAMDQGTLPRRNGVRPHINVTTTIEGLKNEVGAQPADLELSLPISTRTLERISCDSTISRVLLADSMVKLPRLQGKVARRKAAGRKGTGKKQRIEAHRFGAATSRGEPSVRYCYPRPSPRPSPLKGRGGDRVGPGAPVPAPRKSLHEAGARAWDELGGLSRS
jgi:Domain of unknown function (DUF222)